MKKDIADYVKRGNVNLCCLWQRAVLPIIMATTKRKEVASNA